MYSVVYKSAVEKDFKKLDKPVVLVFKEVHLPILCRDPFVGSRLKGKYQRDYRKYKFNFKAVEYRLAYEIKEHELIIILIIVGTRENFYKKLLRRIR